MNNTHRANEKKLYVSFLWSDLQNKYWRNKDTFASLLLPGITRHWAALISCVLLSSKATVEGMKRRIFATFSTAFCHQNFNFGHWSHLFVAFVDLLASPGQAPNSCGHDVKELEAPEKIGNQNNCYSEPVEVVYGRDLEAVPSVSVLGIFTLGKSENISSFLRFFEILDFECNPHLCFYCLCTLITLVSSFSPRELSSWKNCWDILFSLLDLTDMTNLKRNLF